MDNETSDLQKLEDTTVMYVVVRKSLNMSIGKTGVQIGHAVQLLMQKRDELLSYLDWGAKALEREKYEELFNQACIFNKWLNFPYAKIVKEADEREWEKIKQLPNFKDISVSVVDLGRTELPPNTETVIGFSPMFKSQTPKVIKKLQLLK